MSESKKQESQALRGLELAKEVARNHEAELRQIMADPDFQGSLAPLVEGSVTASSLLAEFEDLARAEGIDLDNFYTEASRTSLYGHQFEALAMIQILMEGNKKTIGEEE